MTVADVTGQKPSPLPWQLSDSASKKGPEILDARGATVAKLTALDMANAKLIVSAVNTCGVDVSFISDLKQLITGRSYWLVRKDAMSVARVSICREANGRKFFDDRMWAHSTNNQVTDKYDIFGPIPMPVEPDFEALKKAG